MRRNIFVVFTLFFSVLLFAGCDSSPKITILGQQSVILAFGDSLTYGTGASAGKSYPDVLSEMLGKPVINVGIPGEVSAAGLKRLPSVLDKHNPTLVILCHGGNDFLRRKDEAITTRNLKAMIELIKGRGADVVLVGVPKLGFGLATPKFYEEIAKEYTIPIQRDILVNLLGDNSMKSDGIHPNTTGYRIMAEAIYDVIDKAQE